MYNRAKNKNYSVVAGYNKCVSFFTGQNWTLKLGKLDRGGEDKWEGILILVPLYIKYGGGIHF